MEGKSTRSFYYTKKLKKAWVDLAMHVSNATGSLSIIGMVNWYYGTIIDTKTIVITSIIITISFSSTRMRAISGSLFTMKTVDIIIITNEFVNVMMIYVLIVKGVYPMVFKFHLLENYWHISYRAVIIIGTFHHIIASLNKSRAIRKLQKLVAIYERN